VPLGTEKFMIDGRHTGTGGGNHIVLGGARPDDSAFLRRPDLCEKPGRLLAKHPSLSYLFPACSSDLQPASASGRGFALIRSMNGDCFQSDPRQRRNQHPAGMSDRVLRNLLVDLTGNTHRTS